MKIVKDPIDTINNNIDNFDLAILRELSNNARILNIDISERVCLSPSATLRRHRKLELLNIIEGYHAKINYLLLGYRDLIMIEVKISNLTQKIETKIKHTVAKFGKIIAFYKFLNDPIFIIFLSVVSFFESTPSLHDYISNLESVIGLKFRLISQANGQDLLFCEPRG